MIIQVPRGGSSTTILTVHDLCEQLVSGDVFHNVIEVATIPDMVCVVHAILETSRFEKIQTRLVALHVEAESREKIRLEAVDSHATKTANNHIKTVDKITTRQRPRNHCNAHDVDSVLIVMQKYWLR